MHKADIHRRLRFVPKGDITPFPADADNRYVSFKSCQRDISTAR
jgi:hypothetical protein